MNPAFYHKARVRSYGPRKGMNGLESRYAKTLEGQRIAGEIRSWRYEALTLKLANKTTYTPDFLVVTADGYIECHETKGFFRDDAKVKIKVAACEFPEIRFLLVQEKRGDWVITEISNGREEEA